MTRPVITVDSISKAYRIGQKEEIPDTFVGAMTGWITTPWRNFRRLRQLDTARPPAARKRDSGSGEPFAANGNGSSSTRFSKRSTDRDILWALRDVSFEINEGEVVGIIGRNGAGKSTLLKILTRITEPTSGEAIIRGRVFSLLEVGTGFHPELTGRENIYMNGTILGMRKREIDHKFDEIVDFSEVERFLDTPIKRYSSGMQVRLAFAVAAHLEPEILIVDEVLAVGDAEFQKKCIGKLSDVATHGRTVLFVSHNMGAVARLCNFGIVLSEGAVKTIGPIRECITSYMCNAGATATSEYSLLSVRRMQGETLDTDNARISRVALNDGAPLRHSESWSFMIEFETRKTLNRVALALGLSTPEGQRLMTVDTAAKHEYFSFNSPGLHRVHAKVDRLDLQPGSYALDVGIRECGGPAIDYISSFGTVEVLPGDLTPPDFTRGGSGGVRVIAHWKA